jgi:hypothetical protein
VGANDSNVVAVGISKRRSNRPSLRRLISPLKAELLSY